MLELIEGTVGYQIALLKTLLLSGHLFGGTIVYLSCRRDSNCDGFSTFCITVAWPIVFSFAALIITPCSIVVWYRRRKLEHKCNGSAECQCQLCTEGTLALTPEVAECMKQGRRDREFQAQCERFDETARKNFGHG